MGKGLGKETAIAVADDLIDSHLDLRQRFSQRVNPKLVMMMSSKAQATHNHDLNPTTTQSTVVLENISMVTAVCLIL